MKIVVRASPHVHEAKPSPTTCRSFTMDQLVHAFCFQVFKCSGLRLSQDLTEVGAPLSADHIACFQCGCSTIGNVAAKPSRHAMLGQILGQLNKATHKPLAFVHLPCLWFDERLSPLQEGHHRIFLVATTELKALASVGAGQLGYIVVTNHIHGKRPYSKNGEDGRHLHR